jgi:hypothetical protein
MNTKSSAGNFWLLSARWAPRILAILLAVFVCLFSFDVFGQGTGFWKTLADFLIHNIPTFVLIALILLSWKWPWTGGAGFIILGVLYFIWSAGKGNASIIIGVVLLIIGALFVLDWFVKKDVRKALPEE